MTADIFTKALPQPSFTKHNIELGLIDHSAFLLQEERDDNAYDHENDILDGSTGEGWYC